MICSKCNNKVPVDSEFCPFCGEKIVINNTTDNENILSQNDHKEKTSSKLLTIKHRRIFAICVALVIVAIGVFLCVYFVHHHNYKKTQTIESSCDKDGKTIYSCWCGKNYTEKNKAHHNYRLSKTTEPTCSKKGKNTYACECKDTFSEEIEALGHKYKEYQCVRCGHIQDEKEDSFFFNWLVENGTLTNGTYLDWEYTSESGEILRIYEAGRVDWKYWVQYIIPDANGYQYVLEIPLIESNKVNYSFINNQNGVESNGNFSFSRKKFSENSPIKTGNWEYPVFRDVFYMGQSEMTKEQIQKLDDERRQKVNQEKAAMANEVMIIESFAGEYAGAFNHQALYRMISLLRDEFCPLAGIDIAELGYKKFE